MSAPGTQTWVTALGPVFHGIFLESTFLLPAGFIVGIIVKNLVVMSMAPHLFLSETEKLRRSRVGFIFRVGLVAVDLL